jgi:hypothetical protein
VIGVTESIVIGDLEFDLFIVLSFILSLDLNKKLLMLLIMSFVQMTHFKFSQISCDNLNFKSEFVFIKFTSFLLFDS